jgi:hypothetical protein
MATNGAPNVLKYVHAKVGEDHIWSSDGLL